MQKFHKETGSRFADVQGVKDLYNSPFPHLRMKGMGKCETQPLMILRVIKILMPGVP